MTISTPIVLAAWESTHISSATLSKAVDTIRLLSDSLDFSEEDGDGWNVVDLICECTGTSNGDRDAKVAFVLWTLRLLSPEFKTCFSRDQYAQLLWIFLYKDFELEEAIDLLLDLVGTDVVNTPVFSPGTFTLLHWYILYDLRTGQVNRALVKGLDLHRLGFEDVITPQNESPTSLAMYSSWTFLNWVRRLATAEVDYEKFIEQELERNSLVHPGWDKQTLLYLFTCNPRSDLEFRDDRYCSDCGRMDSFQVQPYWRHFLERIKQGIDPDDPALAKSEVGEVENADVGSIVEVASDLSDRAHETDTAENNLLPNSSDLSSESKSKSESKKDAHGYPEAVSIRSDCVYARNEIVCIYCWLHYRQTGTRDLRHWRLRTHGTPYRRQGTVIEELSEDEEDEDEDEKDEDEEYSPYLIHS